MVSIRTERLRPSISILPEGEFLPPDCNQALISPLGFIIQPEKHDGIYEKVTRTPQEVTFWIDTIPVIDEALVQLADTDQSTLVRRIFDANVTQPVNNGLMARVASMMKDQGNVHCVGFAHGVLPNHQRLYELLRDEKSVDHHLSDGQKRIHTVIVAGTGGNEVKSARVLTEIVPELVNAPLTIISDDLTDTAAALAAYVEQVLSERDASYQYDETLVQSLAGRFGHDYSKCKVLYDTLITKLEQANMLIAIPLYKNQPFVDRLFARLQANHSRWAYLQAQLLEYHAVIPPEYWVMGDGTDTGFKGKEILIYISEEGQEALRNLGLYDNFTHSTLRIGATIPGVIALEPTHYDSDTWAEQEAIIGGEYQYEQLTAWMVKESEKGQRIDKSKLQYQRFMAWVGKQIEDALLQKAA